MRVIIVGAGRIGRNLAKTLAAEGNEIYLIENSEERVQKAMDKLDVKVIFGSGADPDTLKKAQVEQADLVLAVTRTDETNLVVCALSSFYGAKRRIARVRNTSLSTTLKEFGYGQFKVNELINPELLAAQDIVKTIQTPGASEVGDFAEGRILMRGFHIKEGSPLCGISMAEFSDEDFPWPFLIISIIRGEEVIIPKGDTTIKPKDHIYVLLPAQSLVEFLTFVEPNIKMPTKIIIYGSSITGRHVAQQLSKKVREIVLIEEDEDLATEVAGNLTDVRVIHGLGTESDILTECGVEAADAFVSATNNDNSNLIASVLAKKMGAKATIISTQQPDYLAIINALDIDAIVNPQTLAVEQILHLVRGKGISHVEKLLEADTEALEFRAEEGSSVTKAPLKGIKFPKGSIIGAVYNQDEIELAKGNTQIKAGQQVIVFCQRSAVKKLQTLFTNR